MQYLKGESSFRINKHKKTTLKFEWQDDYYAVSIGIGQLKTLRAYIRNDLKDAGTKVPVGRETSLIRWLKTNSK